MMAVVLMKLIHSCSVSGLHCAHFCATYRTLFMIFHNRTLVVSDDNSTLEPKVVITTSEGTGYYRSHWKYSASRNLRVTKPHRTGVVFPGSHGDVHRFTHI